VTTILDPEDVTSVELAGAYQQRWEYEMSLKEIETQMLEPGAGLRSKYPELVRQELWGLLLSHYAIRALMTRVNIQTPALVATARRCCQVTVRTAARFTAGQGWAASRDRRRVRRGVRARLDPRLPAGGHLR